MTLLKGLGTGLCLTMLCVLVTPNAKADERDRKTLITFSGPVEVGGSGAQVLPAGTYLFKAMDSPSDRHIVQISSPDGNHVYTIILAITNYRVKTTDKTVMTFRERPAGEPEALKAWFYPGRQYGDLFVYDRPMAIKLAAETNETVLSSSVAQENGTVETLNAAPVEAVNPAGETVEAAQVVAAPPAVAEAPVAAAPAPVEVASLPKTASNLGLIGLLGMMFLGSGFLVSGLLKKSI